MRARPASEPITPPATRPAWWAESVVLEASEEGVLEGAEWEEGGVEAAVSEELCEEVVLRGVVMRPVAGMRWIVLMVVGGWEEVGVVLLLLLGREGLIVEVMVAAYWVWVMVTVLQGVSERASRAHIV